MFCFFKKSHLRYRSIREWMQCEGIPTSVSTIQDEKLRNEYFDQYIELRKHLFNQHLKSLSDEERDQLRNGQHPSQSHSQIEAAKRYAKQLHAALQDSLPIEEVTVGIYHGDRLVLNLKARRQLTPEEELQIPQFFRGFEVTGAFISN